MTEKLDNIVERALGYRYAFAVLAIFTLAFGLRYYPVRNIQYLQALDPYNLFRMSQQIAYTGSLPDVDFMRYFPFAMPTYTAHQLNLWIPALLYWLGGSVLFDSYLDFAHTMMPLFSGLAAVTTYFLGKELFDKYTGLGAAFFIAVIPGAMFRSSAGFFEKEATGTFFMLVSLLFFTLAWKRRDWLYGIISGLALGIFTATWGGSQMMWFLYPMIIGFMLLINEETEEMIASYTPTVLIAIFVAVIFNPGRFWFDSMYVYLNIGFLGLLWARYLVEQFAVISKEKLQYFIPSTYILGVLTLAISPLYSQTLAQLVFSIYNRAIQSGGSVIGGTVAENAAPGMQELTTQLGSGIFDGILPGAGLIAALFGAWTLVFLSVPLMASTIYLMLGRKYGLIEDALSGKKQYAIIAGLITSWTIGFAIFFEGYRAIGIITAVLISIMLSVMNLYFKEDSAFNISLISLIFTALIASLYALGQGSVQETATILRGLAYPVWIAAAGLGVIYATDSFKSIDISMDWYMIIPLFWLGSNLLVATSRSRLIYLAAFATALGAGYTLSRVIRKIQVMEFTELGIKTSHIRFAALAILAVGILSVNVAAGFLATSNIGGSPNEAWMQNLDYLNEETDNGDVVMSWWDYGYHFQSLGRSASVADGGNFNYYVDDDVVVNYYLAEYFASDDPRENYAELFERHSTDYVVLDNTMIGKYSAVSQIAERDNENFNTMFQASTPGTLEQSVSQSGDRTVAEFRGVLGAQRANIFVPLEISETSVAVSDSATIQTAQGDRIESSCVLTDEGIQEFGDGESEFCIAVDPYYSMERSLSHGIQTRIAIIPREISEHNMMKLYFMDGHGIDYLEKVEGASNDYMKMWEVTE